MITKEKIHLKTQKATRFDFDHILPGFFILSLLFFLSGATSLTLQVIWMYRLGLIFGNAAYATAATLAAFFLGLSLGGWLSGRLSIRLKKPLTAYGLMEMGIALTALFLYPGLDFYETNYAEITALFSSDRTLLTLSKFLFSTTLLIFPTMLMGGTFPMLAQFIGENSHLARRGTLLYTFNTLGAAVGAFIAGFFLISSIGVNATYAYALIVASAIGLAAVIIDRLPIWSHLKGSSSQWDHSRKNDHQSKPRSADAIDYKLFVILAFSSGILALSAEMLWTRMFAQVLQNSVYSFSAIIVVFLIALGCGGGLSHWLVRIAAPVIPALLALLSMAAIFVGLTPFVFNIATDGMAYLSPSASWPQYIRSVFWLAFLVVFPPTLVLGAIFPFLLKLSPSIDQKSGRFVGKLVLFNSLGSTVGPLIAGLVLIDLLGLWGSIKVIALGYGGMAFLIAFNQPLKKKKWAALPLAGIIAILTLAEPSSVKLEPGQRVLETWQSSDGIVSVVQSGENVQIRLNNYYVLGDSRSALVEQMQGHIPLLIHPNPKKVLFLGMGTGITAGASISHDVGRVVTVELVSDVITAAQRYFSPLLNGLFEDRRVEVIADDARNYLLGTSEKFDVIVGDLFTPWHAGTGSLYSAEHFERVKGQLTPGGLFAQWLPLYQLTPRSFETIAATFASIFPQVTLWRADFSGSRPSIALIGQTEDTKLDQATLKRNIVNVLDPANPSQNSKDHMVGLFYLGNFETIRDRFVHAPLNTDNRRTIEYMVPIWTQTANAGDETYLVGKQLESLLIDLSSGLPAQRDPYLSLLPSNEIKYVRAGLLYYIYHHLLDQGRENEAKEILGQIRGLAPDFLSGATIK
ncbi:MAG: fused MFS/spermidine synthase [Cyclobacteriaceae bacterium]